MAINPLLVSTISVDELPPSGFNLTDKIPHSIAGSLFSGTIQDLVNLVTLNASALQNEIKYLSVNNQYIIDNFDTTGLGKNLCLGFAIMNGNNGTTNIDGKVLVSYGTVYNTLGQFGGTVTHTLVNNELPIHSHLNGMADDIADSFVYGATSVGMPGLATKSLNNESTNRNLQGNTSQVGANLPHNNMQPYIVVLAIKKL